MGALGEIGAVLQNDVGAEVAQLAGDIVAPHDIDRAHTRALSRARSGAGRLPNWRRSG